jgi:hypothetical protein
MVSGNTLPASYEELTTVQVEQQYLPLIRAMVQGSLTLRQASVMTNIPAPTAAQNLTTTDGDKIPLVESTIWRNLVLRERKAWQDGLDITRRDIIEGMKEAIELAMMTQDAAAAIKGWTEIGKLVGVYAPVKQEVALSVSGSATITHLERMTDEELMKLINDQPKPHVGHTLEHE